MAAYKRGPYKKTDKTCEHCGTTFQGVKNAQFCSSKCRVYAHRAKAKKND
jgi:hypothetical protein